MRSAGGDGELVYATQRRDIIIVGFDTCQSTCISQWIFVDSLIVSTLLTFKKRKKKEKEKEKERKDKKNSCNHLFSFFQFFNFLFN
jgi:hypothetical protein